MLISNACLATTTRGNEFFLAPDYLAMTRDCNVVKSVHVQAFGFPGNSVGKRLGCKGKQTSMGIPRASSGIPI